MKRLLFAFAVMLAIFAGILPSTITTAQPQPKVILELRVKLVALQKPSYSLSDERSCQYFFLTKNFSQNQHVSFSYKNADGVTTSEVPLLTDITISYDKDATVPIAISDDPENLLHKTWQLVMSEETYRANLECLKDIPIKQQTP